MKYSILFVILVGIMTTSCSPSFSSYETKRVDIGGNPKFGAVEHNYIFRNGDIVYNKKTNITYRIDSVQYRKNAGGYFYYATDITTGQHVKNLLEKVLVSQTDNSRYAGVLLP